MSSFLSNPLVISLIGALICTAVLIFTVFKKNADENSSPFQLKKVLLTFGFIFTTILIINFLNTGTKGGKLTGGASLTEVMKGGKPDLAILTDSFD